MDWIALKLERSYVATVPSTISETPKSSSTMNVLLTTSYSNATDSNVDSKTVSSLDLDTQGTPISNITGTTTSSTSNIVTTSNDGNTPGSILIMIENLYVLNILLVTIILYTTS